MKRTFIKNRVEGLEFEERINFTTDPRTSLYLFGNDAKTILHQEKQKHTCRNKI